MPGGSNYNELHEKVARIEILINLKDDSVELVDVMTQIHGVNIELVVYHAAGRQLDGLVYFNETVGTQIKDY